MMRVFLIGLVSILATGLIACESGVVGTDTTPSTQAESSIQNQSIPSVIDDAAETTPNNPAGDPNEITTEPAVSAGSNPPPTAMIVVVPPSATNTVNANGNQITTTRTPIVIPSPSLVTTNKADTSTKITYISEDWSNIWLCKDLIVESTDLTTGGTQTCSVSTEVVGNNLIITSTGIPNHDFESTLGCCASDQNSVWTIPLEPELSTDEPVMAPERGAVAFTVTGVAIYGPEEGPGGDAVALEYGYFVEDRQEIDLGVCGGHSGPGGEYHYHYDSNCMHWHEDSQGISGYALDIVSTVVSKIIGFAFDGFPIYSTYEENSSGAVLETTSSYRLKVGEDGYGGIDDYGFVENLGDLDECNGHFGTTPEAPAGMYHYHTTLNNGEGDLGFPYFPLCYKGIVNEENYSATNGLGGGPPAGGPPAGGPPAGGPPAGGPPAGGPPTSSESPLLR
jgi:hypothetical protein